MQKRLKKTTPKQPAKPKRPSDPNRAAHAMLAEHMSRVQPEHGDDAVAAPLDFDAQYKAHMAKLGRKGGKISGSRRMQNLSDMKRREIAKKAAAARWAKK